MKLSTQQLLANASFLFREDLKCFTGFTPYLLLMQKPVFVSEKVKHRAQLQNSCGPALYILHQSLMTTSLNTLRDGCNQLSVRRAQCFIFPKTTLIMLLAQCQADCADIRTPPSETTFITSLLPGGWSFLHRPRWNHGIPIWRQA